MIEERNQNLNLNLVFQNAKPISNIASMHHFEVENGDHVVAYLLTKDKTNSTEDESNCNTPTSSRADPSASDPLGVGDWYTVEYEGVLYPGEVISIGDQGDYQVSVMEPAWQKWKWPNPEDKIFYPKKKLVVKLDKPELVNRCGHYKFSAPF